MNKYKIEVLHHSNIIHVFALTILLISNICFYTEETMKIYILFTLTGIVLEFFATLIKTNTRTTRVASCIIWLIIIYAMFTFNGLLRLRYGTYNWDFMIYTCVQNIALYFAFKSIFQDEYCYKNIKLIILSCMWISVLIIIIEEASNIAAGETRIGDSLSGNVVSVGAYLGLLSVFLSYICCKERKMFYWISLATNVAFMLLTGSKVCLLILVIDLYLFLKVSKKKRQDFFLVGIIVLVLAFVIFSVPYFYQIIGFRIEDMMFQMFGIGEGHYSNSTRSREILIKEGLKFMWDYPIFGGGEKYFGSKTSTVYAYSHNNYIDIVVNFGLVGFLIYYVPVLRNLVFMIRTRKKAGNIAELCIALMIMRLVVDMTMMTHSEPCIGYIPMIMSFVYVDNYKSRRTTSGRYKCLN